MITLMHFYTGFFQLRDSIEILQCSADDAAAALRELLGRLPHDDGIDFTEPDFLTITETINGTRAPEMTPVTACQNAWYWLDGSRMSDRIDAYVVATSNE